LPKTARIGLRVSKEYGGSIQLLLADMILPKMSGKEIAAKPELLTAHAPRKHGAD
jgi:hypothetical protein